MNYLSVCSGIEAASVAWRPLGWKAVAFSEIDPFACAVLAHHYPDVPNWGDMTRFKDWPDAAIDVLCGGTPCQSFSAAGLRAGLDDPRGELMLTFGAIAARYRPRWLVWENVPGVLSSNGGRDFGAFLGLLGIVGYGFAYRVLDAQYVRVDGYARAVPQRRQRVFVVGCLGDWRSAAAVLLERESLRGDSAPRRAAGARVAGALAASAGGSDDNDAAGERIVAGAIQTSGPGSGWRIGADEAAANHIVAYGGNNTSGPREVASALSAHGGTGRHDFESETFIAHTLRGDGFDASEGGTGRGTPLVAHAFDARQSDVIQYGDKAGPLDTDGHTQAIAFDTTQITSAANRSNPQPGGPSHPLAATAHAPAIASASSVRRLMPVETERLQGFPDGYTAIQYRGKPAADGPRYRAIGNSWAVNCPRWIGRRIEMVARVTEQEKAMSRSSQKSRLPRARSLTFWSADAARRSAAPVVRLVPKASIGNDCEGIEMDRPPTPEFAFRLGAEAMRTKAAAWAMTRGLTPVAIDLLNMDVPAFSLPDTMTLERHERDSGIVEFRDDRPPPEYTPNPPLVWDEGKKA